MSIQAMSRVMSDSEARGIDRLVLLVMANRAGGDHDECFASIERLSHECRVDQRTVQRAQRRLVESGDLALMGVHPKYRTNIHRVLPASARVAESHPLGTSDPSAPPELNEPVSQGSVVDSRVLDSDVLARDFGEFYGLYPRKKARGTALKAYKAARKKATHNQILDGLRRALPDFASRPANKVPYPATWLNGEGWDDEPDAAGEVLEGPWGMGMGEQA